jgi:hypothetical protein
MNRTLTDLGISSSSVEDAVEEATMISQSCDFDEFIESVRDRDYLEVIYLADKEATEAERLKYRSKHRRLDPPGACAGYADVLKGFICFMRYGVKSPSMEDTLHEGLQAFREAALENYMERAEFVEGSGGRNEWMLRLGRRSRPCVSRCRPLAEYPYRSLRIRDGTRNPQCRCDHPTTK